VHELYGLLAEEVSEVFDEVRHDDKEGAAERLRSELQDVMVVCLRGLDMLGVASAPSVSTTASRPSMTRAEWINKKNIPFDKCENGMLLVIPNDFRRLSLRPMDIGFREHDVFAAYVADSDTLVNPVTGVPL
jgi:hypothetical protein